MAAVPSTFAPRGRLVRHVRGCSIDTDPPLSTELRISLDPTNNIAIIRLRMEVGDSPNPLWLDMAPENIQSLSLDLEPPPCLDFRVTSVSMIVPEDLLPQSLETEDRITLESLRLFAQRTSVRVFLPENEEDFSQLTALCEAVSRGGLSSDPAHTLKMLYRGKGGRVVQVDEAFLPSPSLFSTAMSLLDMRSHSLTLPPSIEQLPPEYSRLGSTPLRPSPSTHDRKRIRTCTASLSSSSSPDYNTWKHLDLAVGEREKIMAKLLSRAEMREENLRKTISIADEKLATLNLLISKLDLGGPDYKGGESHAAHKQAEPRASQVSTCSATSAASPRSTTSISSNISERIQASIDVKLNKLRGELVSEYEAMEQNIMDEVDSRLSGYMADYEMEAAIDQAIDNAMATIRERVLDTWG